MKKSPQKKENTKQLIVIAACDMFYEKGFEETTFADIAKKAGISQPAIYAHFENKMDILKSVCIFSAEMGRAYIDSQVNPHEKALNRLKSYLLANLDFFNSQKHHANAIFALYYFSTSSQEMHTVYDLVQSKTVERLVGMLIQGQHEKEYHLKDTTEVALTLQSLLVGDCFKAVSAKSAVALKKVKKSHWQAASAIINFNASS